jgi:hypothetical protein
MYALTGYDSSFTQFGLILYAGRKSAEKFVAEAFIAGRFA